MSEKNWARNVTYSAAKLRRPKTLAELQELVAKSRAASALGSRHSFNTVADTPGDLISLERLDVAMSIDSDAMTVTVNPGVKYGVLGAELQKRGYGLANLASLPHISVAGATATATHGSGNSNQNLASSIAGLQVVHADGSLVELRRGDPDFDAYAVGIGALGIITSITLDIEPTFDIAVSVFERLAWNDLYDNVDAITGAAYSVSLFTSWGGDTVDQVWLKRKLGRHGGAQDGSAASAPAENLLSAVPATKRLHPLPGVSAIACTEQLGIPGAWVDRLPHFRLDFTPSNGDEIQSEFLIPREHAIPAFEAMRALAPRIQPLLQISEIRTVARDAFWLSSAYERDAMGLHFTWKPRQAEVEALLPDIEAALAPFGARPHWGKVFTAPASAVAPLYDRMPDFIALADRVDPEQKFRNDFLRRHAFGA